MQLVKLAVKYIYLYSSYSILMFLGNRIALRIVSFLIIGDILLYIKFAYKFSYTLSVYSPFFDRVGLPLHNTPFPGVLMKSIGAAFFDRMPFLTSTTCMGWNIE